MKNIFTYPNNPTYGYVNPNYYGDDNSGFYKRVDDLRDGTYKTWNGTSPTLGTNQIIPILSKYNAAFRESWDENTIYQWWYQPVVEAHLRAKEELVKDYSIVIESNTPKLVVEYQTSTSNVDGSRVYPFGHVTDSFEDAQIYYDNIDGTTGYITDNASHTDFEIDKLNGTRYDTRKFGANQNSTAYRDDTGSILRFVSDTPDWQTGDVAQLISGFTDVNDTGTLNQTGTPFYVERLGSYSYKLYTDAARTTRATLNEHYVTSGTKTFTTAGTYNLDDELFSDYGITDLSGVQAEGVGFCRITATVNSGTFVGADDSTKTIPTSKSFSVDFYWEYLVGAKFRIFDTRSGDKVFQDFTISGATPDVDIEIEFINPARTVHGWCRYLNNDTTDAGMSLSDSLSNTYEVHFYRIATYGNETFTYQDANNVTQLGSKFQDEYWLEGATSGTDIGSETYPSASQTNLDSNGRFTGFDAFPSGVDDSRGSFSSGDRRLLKLESEPDIYVAPSESLAEQQDNWNEADDWDSAGYTSNNKAWPRNVSPANAILRYDMPSTVTKSQGGTKYVRGSGFTRWQIEVTYPPMTKDDFRHFHTTAQLAQGQAIPFYFELRDKDGGRILFDYHNSNSESTIRVKRDNYVDKQVLLEGFPGELSDAVVKGELIIVDEDNGRVNTVAVSEDSNVYGEVLVTFPFPASGTQTAGNFAYLDPFHVVVTLADNGFEYSVDTAGLYYMTVTFDLDEFK